jgi:CRP-like cAMP-binding protein
VPDRTSGTRSSSILERVLYLKMLDQTGDLRSSDLAVVAELSRERYFSKGTVLFKSGEPVDVIQLIIEGRVEARHDDLQLADMVQGDAVGWLSFLARDPRGIEARAATDVRSLELDAEALMDVLEDRFSLTYGFIKSGSRRLLSLLVETPWAFRSLRSFDLPAPHREMDFVERIVFLRKVPIFRKSSINALAELSRGLTEVRFDAGTDIWHKGDISGGVFILIDGTVQCRSDADGIDFSLGPGGPLGSLESLAEMPRFYDAKARTEVWALHGSAESLLDVFEDNFEMASDYLQAVAADIIRMVKVKAGVEKASGPIPTLSGMMPGAGPVV